MVGLLLKIYYIKDDIHNKFKIVVDSIIDRDNYYLKFGDLERFLNVHISLHDSNEHHRVHFKYTLLHTDGNNYDYIFNLHESNLDSEIYLYKLLQYRRGVIKDKSGQIVHWIEKNDDWDLKSDSGLYSLLQYSLMMIKMI